MRELPRPPESDSDPKATEMLRAWIAHNDLHVSLLLGMWQDAAESEVDERQAWGELLGDLVQHIANGLAQSHGWEKEDTILRVAAAFQDRIMRPVGDPTGEYVDNDEDP